MSTTKWALDPAHSEVRFKVRHLMISNVSGHFAKFEGSVETEGDDVTTAKVHFTAELDSISTNNEQRDAHLKTADFFDATNHTQVIFEGQGLEKVDDENYQMHGTLTIRGTAKPVTLAVEYNGVTKDPWGNTRTGFGIKTKINRKDFGVSFGAVTETGGLLLGDDVTITGETEFVQVAATQPA